MDKLDWLTDLRAYGLLALLCMALYLPGLASLPPIDRDEARFAQATRQMIEDWDYVRIRFQNEPRNKKPAGVYWLQAASVETFGGGATDRIWPYRLPSVFGAALAVLLTFAFGKRLFDSRQAFLAASITAASLVLTIEAHQATTDAALLASAVAAQGSLGLIYCRTRGAEPAPAWPAFCFWIAQGVSILIKGPVIPAVSLLTIIALAAADRSFKWLKALRPLAGLAICAAIVLPWAVAIGKATQWAFFSEAVGKDLLPKLISGQESHGFFPGYFLLLVWITFWPGSPYLIQSLRAGWRSRQTPETRFLLAWLLPAWLMFELVPTKLPHYVMPLYPALALLTAGFALEKTPFALRACPGPDPGYRRATASNPKDPAAGPLSRLDRVSISVWAVVGLILAAGPVALPLALEGRFDPWSLWTALGAIGGTALAIRFTIRRRAAESILAGIACAVLVMPPLLGGILPNVNSIWLSRSVAQAVQDYSAAHQGRPVRAAAAGYAEPSLVFMLGTGTLLTDAQGAASFLAQSPDGLAIVSDKEAAAFRQKVSGAGISPRLVSSVTGFNYSEGRKTTLDIYTGAPGPAQ